MEISDFVKNDRVGILLSTDDQLISKFVEGILAHHASSAYFCSVFCESAEAAAVFDALLVFGLRIVIEAAVAALLPVVLQLEFLIYIPVVFRLLKCPIQFGPVYMNKDTEV